MFFGFGSTPTAEEKAAVTDRPVCKELEALVSQLREGAQHAESRVAALLDEERQEREAGLSAIRRRVESQQAELVRIAALRVGADLHASAARERQEMLSAIAAIHSDVESLRGAVQAMAVNDNSPKQSKVVVADVSSELGRRIEALEEDQQQNSRNQAASEAFRAERGEELLFKISRLEARLEALAKEGASRSEYRTLAAGPDSNVISRLETVEAQLRDGELDSLVIRNAAAHGPRLQKLEEEVEAVNRAVYTECQQRSNGEGKLSQEISLVSERLVIVARQVHEQAKLAKGAGGSPGTKSDSDEGGGFMSWVGIGNS